MAGGQGDKAGFGGEGGRDEVRRDSTRSWGFQQTNGDAVTREAGPGVDVGWVIIGITDDLITGLPIEAVGDEAEAD